MGELPEEILQLIFPYLKLSIIRKAYPVLGQRLKLDTLCNISLASRQFHRLVSPALYHTIDVDLIGFDNFETLLRKLIDRPALCKLVRRAIFPKFSPADWEVPENSPYRSEDDSWIEVLNRYNVPPASDTDEEVEAFGTQFSWTIAHREPHAQVAMFMCMCDGLYHLNIEVASMFSDTPDYGKNMFIEAAKWHVEHTDTVDAMPFAPLQTIELRSPQIDSDAEEQETRGLVTFAPILQIPTLRTFYAEHQYLTETYMSEGSDLPADMRSSVRCLHMQDACVDARGLRQILVGCPELEELCISSAPYNFFWEGNPDIDRYTEFASHLCSHAVRLKKLILKVRDSDWFGELATQRVWRGHVGEVQPIGDLSSLVNLEYLGISTTALWGRRLADESPDVPIHALQVDRGDPALGMLPCSLKTLRVYTTQDESTADQTQIKELIDSLHYEHLATVEFERLISFSKGEIDACCDGTVPARNLIE